MKIWSKQLLIKPDPTPYLMASRSVRLLAAPGASLLWPSTPQLLSDTLSNKTVGQAPFEFSFSVHADVIGAGTVFLLDMPGLVNIKAEDNTLMFKFGWKDGWAAVPASVLIAGWNAVSLSSDGVRIRLTVNAAIFTLLDSEAHWVSWQQPIYPAYGETGYDDLSAQYNNNQLTAFPRSGTFTSKNGSFSFNADNNYYLSGVYGEPWALSDGFVPAESEPYSGDLPYEDLNKNFQGIGSNDGSFPSVRTSFPFFWSFGKELRIRKIDVYQMRTFLPWYYADSPICCRDVYAYSDGTKAELMGTVTGMGLTSGQKYTITVNNMETAYLWLELFGEEATFNNKGNATAGLSEIKIEADEKVPGDEYPPITTGQLTVRSNWLHLKNIQAVL